MTKHRETKKRTAYATRGKNLSETDKENFRSEVKKTKRVKETRYSSKKEIEVRVRVSRSEKKIRRASSFPDDAFSPAVSLARNSCRSSPPRPLSFSYFSSRRRIRGLSMPPRKRRGEDDEVREKNESERFASAFDERRKKNSTSHTHTKKTPPSSENYSSNTTPPPPPPPQPQPRALRTPSAVPSSASRHPSPRVPYQKVPEEEENSSTSNIGRERRR